MEAFVRRWLFDPTIGKFITVIVAVVIVIVLVQFFQRSISRYVKDSDTRYRARKGITFLGYVVAIFIIAIVFSSRLSGLTVAFGVAGAGIAFALQEVIASVAGWAAISFAGFFRPGDRVELGGIKGDVIDVSLLRTTLMELGEWVKGDLYTGRIVRVANSFVFKAPVFNYSGDFPFLWDEIIIPVKYGSDYQLARKIFERVADEVVGEYASQAANAWKDIVRKFLIEDATVAPMVTLVANDNWIEFTLRYVVNYKMRRVTKDRLFTRILEEIDQTEGRVSMASATFELVGAPAFDVRVADRPGPIQTE
jgi:small-conductance mechanosensitive channel